MKDITIKNYMYDMNYDLKLLIRKMVLKYHVLEITYYVDETAFWVVFVIFAVVKRLREGLLNTFSVFLSHDREAMALN